MSAACCHHAHDEAQPPQGPRYRRVLWVALIVNAAMFAVEIAAGFTAGSVSLLADAVDFFGDAVNYASRWRCSAWRSRGARVPRCSRA